MNTAEGARAAPTAIRIGRNCRHDRKVETLAPCDAASDKIRAQEKEAKQ